jgi:hypothetical protein
MALSGALSVFPALASASGERLLLCRPKIAGDAALARADAVAEAARKLPGRFLDYGVACEDDGEGARAARRAGLSHAVTATAEGRADGSRYVLVLTEAESESVRSRRAIEIGAGADAVRPLRGALDELLDALPPSPGPDRAHLAAWSVTGAGVAAIAVGVALAISAGDAADRADAARDPAAYTRARRDWDGRRKWSAVALGAGGAAAATGLAWRFVF